MPAGVEIFQRLGAHFGIYGLDQAKTQMVRAGHDLDTLNKALEKTRTQFLFMAFGLLAAGAMIKRFGDQLKATMDNMVNAFQSVEYQSVIAGSVMNATAGETRAIREEMLQLGRDTEWTATQAGAAMQRLAMAGFNLTETLGSANSVLQLATIGLTDTTTAAKLAVGVYRGFSFEAETAGEVTQNMSTIVSNLAYAATHSAAMIEELGEALKYTAATAEMVGWELETVTAGLMVAADNMVQAGIAGRAMRMSMINLSRASGLQSGMTMNLKDLLEEYNVVVDDGQGKLLGLADIVDNLNESFEDLSDTQKTTMIRQMFGARSTTLWSALLKGQGDAIRYNELAMKSAAVKEQLFIMYGRDATSMLGVWRNEVQNQNADIDDLTEQLIEMGFQGEVLADVVEVITSDFERADDAIKSAGVASEITAERLSTLHGATLLLDSSVDALWASIGQEMAPIMMEWFHLIRRVADTLSQLHPWVKRVIGAIIILGAVLIPLIGKSMMFLGTISMLVAALAMLTKQTGVNISMDMMLAYAYELVGKAISRLLVKVWALTISFAKLMIQLGALYLTFLFIEHVFRKFGPVAGMVTMAIFALGWAIWLLRKHLQKMWIDTGISTLSMKTYTMASMQAVGGTYAWVGSLTTLHIVMMAMPIIVLATGIILIATGMRELGLVIIWLAVLWAVLNAVMWGNPIMMIIAAFAAFIAVILTVLESLGKLEEWFSGEHCLNTIVKYSSKGTKAMEGGFEDVSSSMKNILDVGKSTENIFNVRKKLPAGPTAAPRGRSVTVTHPSVINKFEKVEFKGGMTAKDLDNVVRKSTESAMNEWNRTFIMEEGY